MNPVLNYIDGQFVESHSGKTLLTVNPATGEPLAEVARSNGEDVEAATQAALTASASWSATTLEQTREMASYHR